MEIKEYCCFCGTCVAVCPQAALELLSEGRVEIHTKKCVEYLCRRWNCGLCAKVCPVGAIIIR